MSEWTSAMLKDSLFSGDFLADAILHFLLNGISSLMRYFPLSEDFASLNREGAQVNYYQMGKFRN